MFKENNLKPILFVIIFFVFPITLYTQVELKGIILETSTSKEIPLQGANVFWLNSTVGGVTAEDGTFTIPYKFSFNKLVISYVGFKTDTITVNEN